MANMRVVQVTEPGGRLELAERPIPEPGPGEVRVKVQACGVCHSDSFAVSGQFPGVSYPLVPGHEVAGVLDGVPGWSIGQRVGRDLSPSTLDNGAYVDQSAQKRLV